jgi:predicted alpha/beta-fold hydrolase
MPETRKKILANPHITYVETEDGGHCAFVGQRSSETDGRWAEREVVDFVQRLETSRSRERLVPLPAN